MYGLSTDRSGNVENAGMPSWTSLDLQRRDDGVVVLTMNRPAVFNAFDEALIAELDAAFDLLGGDAGVRAIVLAGAGKHFSAGADLQWMQRAAAASQEDNLADARRFSAMLARIAECPKPTVARVQGAALGGGVGLVCACDMAVASEAASFSVSEARMGILPAVIGPHLVNAVGLREARRLALTASRIGADEALRVGLVQRAVSAGELDAAVEAFIADLLACGPRAQAEIKQLYARLAPGPVTADVRELTAQTIARVRTTPEAREGFAAFLGKRKPNWTSSE
jgi:methylglutaconyl-CoA hydratase